VASVGQKADVDGSTTPRSSQAILVTSGKPTSSNNSLSQAGQWINHQVLRGETLWSISRRYSVSVNDLLSWNQLSLDRPLQLDQVLRLLH
jgi:LysM repeat protein